MLLVAIDLFSSIISNSKLQPLLPCFRRPGSCQWVLKETVHDITRLVKERVRCTTKTRRPLVGSTFSALIHEFSLLSANRRADLLPLYNTTGHCRFPSLPFAWGLLPRNCASTKNCVAAWWGRESCGSTRVYLGSSPSATGIIPESRANPRGRPDTDYRLYENRRQNVHEAKEIDASNTMLYSSLLKISQSPLFMKCNNIFANSVIYKNRGIHRHASWFSWLGVRLRLIDFRQ